MIRKLVRQMLTAQTLSALTVSLCLLIDNIMIGRFLGPQAIAAYGLANPVLLAFAAIGSMLSAGIQVVCSRSIGEGSQEETNRGYSSAVGAALIISAALTLIVLLFHGPLATAMGAGTSGELYDMTSDYMAGFIIGAPATMGALILVPFMQMAGKNGLLVAAVLGMTVADVGLDLINVLVVHGGMFGMGLASSISYYVALIVGGAYFFTKKCVFRFSRKNISRKKIAELFKSGIPSVFNMAASVVTIFIMNRILLGLGGSAAVAAYSVMSTIGNASNCITTGIGGVSLTLSGVFWHEEDITSIKALMRLLARWSVILGIAMGAVLLIFAPAFVGLFLPESGPAQSMAVLGLRLFAAGMIPCCLNNMIKNMYQATERVYLTEWISVLEGAALPVLAAFILSRFLGTTGAWFFFAAGEALALIGIGLMIKKKTGLLPWRDGACLMLPPDAVTAPDDLKEWDLRSLKEVAEASREAGDFCRRHDLSEKTSAHVALCVEEMAANTIQYGFGAKSARRHLSVRILSKKGRTILRFRDDCGAFDPIHYIPGEGKDALGIRLVMATCQEIRYTYSLNLNNLTLEFSDEAAGSAGTGTA